MNAHCPKQYLRLAGKTVLEHSLGLMLTLTQLESLVLCLGGDDAYIAEILPLDARIRRVTGGATRAQSVLNGLQYLKDYAANDDWVLVHDAARPCLSPELLQSFVTELNDDAVGGILALRARDTLKACKSDDQTVISRTLDRSLIWHAQTPQMFRYGLLIDALTQAVKQNFEITDEASAMEHAGHSVRLLDGSSQNIKITTPEDLALADFLMSKDR